MPTFQPHEGCHPTLLETRTPRRAPPLTLRPIVLQDAGLLAQLLNGLAPATRHKRFHGAFKPSASHLRQMASIDTRSQLAVVVSTLVDGSEQLIADARYVVEPGGQRAEFALVVADRWQRQGVGAWAMQSLQRAATSSGVQWLHGDVQEDNLPMLGLMQRCGFALDTDAEDERIVKAQCRLGACAVLQPVAKTSLRAWLRNTWPSAALVLSRRA